METTAQYSVREDLMYATSRVMWSNCDNNLEVFAANRGIYSASYIAAKLIAIDMAQAMANDVQRTSAHEAIRIHLSAQGDVCCDAFQMLKLYVRHAFSKADFDTQYKDAGGDLYAESAQGNRITLPAMMLQGSNYMDANNAALTANGNMPDTFQVTYREAMDAYNALNADYNASRQAATLGAAQKVEANNAVYNDCIAMGLDGQQFFKNSPLRSQFSFEAVSSMLSPTGASTAVITVVNAETERAIVAQVENENTGRIITTESDGKCEMGNLSATETSFRISAAGFAPQLVTMNLKTGTTSRQTVEMVPQLSDAFNRAPVPENGITEIVDPANLPMSREQVAVVNS